MLTYLHGIALDTGPVPDDLDVIRVDAGDWAVFSSRGPFADALQQLWAATATEWFPSNRGGHDPAHRSCATSNSPRTSPTANSGCLLRKPEHPACRHLINPGVAVAGARAHSSALRNNHYRHLRSGW